MIYTLIHCATTEEAKRIAALAIGKKAAVLTSIVPAEVFSCDMPSPGSSTSEALLIAVTSEQNLAVLEDIARDNPDGGRAPRIASFVPHRVNHEFKEWLAKC